MLMPRTAQVTACGTRCMVLWSATKRATLPTNAFGTACGPTPLRSYLNFIKSS
jgi:hypothetical protein